MAIHNKESTPPPTIGKIGPYTVFLTPPPTPAPTSPPSIVKTPDSPSPQPRTPPPPMVQPPPQQFHREVTNEGSVFMGFFRNAAVKVQNANSSLDEFVAHWFGLNQSKYQWALDDYYETKGGNHVEAKAAKEISSKVQSV